MLLKIIVYVFSELPERRYFSPSWLWRLCGALLSSEPITQFLQKGRRNKLSVSKVHPRHFLHQNAHHWMQHKETANLNYTNCWYYSRNRSIFSVFLAAGCPGKVCIVSWHPVWINNCIDSSSPAGTIKIWCIHYTHLTWVQF